MDRLRLRALAALLAGLSIGWVGPLQAVTVRLARIDAPEMAQATYGEQARRICRVGRESAAMCG